MITKENPILIVETENTLPGATTLDILKTFVICTSEEEKKSKLKLFKQPTITRDKELLGIAIPVAKHLDSLIDY